MEFQPNIHFILLYILQEIMEWSNVSKSELRCKNYETDALYWREQ